MIKPISEIYINKNHNRGTFIEAHIADIHFGALDPKVQYQILREQFINKIYKLPKLDIVSINGDLFHHKNLASSDVVMYSSLFVDELVQLCKEKNSTLLILSGTYSHDAGQLKLFYKYLKDPTIDIRIIENTQFQIVKSKRILCLPEEYGKGENYYNNFLYMSGIYDSVYMHGTIKGSIIGANKEDLDTQKAPVFDLKNFINCRGPIISGHVHVPGCFQKYMYYCGSPIRWCYGEEQEKGFIILTHDLDNGYHYVHFEPIKSFRYDTINMDNILNKDPKDIINHIKEIQAKGIDNIRVEFTLNQQDKLNIIKNYFRNNSHIKIFENFEEDINTSIDEEVLNKYDKYNYILDPNIDEYEKLCRYINQNEGHVFITCDELKSLILDVF